MFKRLLLVLIFLMLLTVSVSAIDDDEVRQCGNLSEADCDLYYELTTATAEVDSAHFNMIFDIVIEDGTLRGEYPFSFIMDGDFINRNPMPEIPELDVSTNDGIREYFNIIGDVFTAFDTQFTFRMEASSELEPIIPQSLSFDIRLVDGFGYLNLSEMQALDPTLPDGWHGTDLPALMRFMGTTMGPLLVQPDAVAPETLDADILSPLENLSDEEYARMLTITRLPDKDDYGQTLIGFQLEFHLDAMLENEAVREIMLLQLGLQSDDPRTQEQQLRLLENAVLTMEIYGGQDDHYLYSLALHMEMYDTLTGAFKQVEPSGVGMSLDFLFRLSDFNDIEPIAAPDNPTLYTPFQLYNALLGN